MTHTPGPWNLVRLASSFDSRVVGYGIKYGASGNRLAMVDGEGNSSDHNEENARLIAAAPDMLAALQAIDKAAAEVEATDGPADDRALWTAIYAARAAIARATGEK